MKIEESPETNHHIIKKVMTNGNGEVNGKCGSTKVKDCKENGFESVETTDDSSLNNTKHNAKINIDLNSKNNNNITNGNSNNSTGDDGNCVNGDGGGNNSKPKSKINASKNKGNQDEIDKLSNKLKHQSIGEPLANGIASESIKSACNGDSEKHDVHVATNGVSSESLNTTEKPVTNVNDIESQTSQTHIADGKGNCDLRGDSINGSHDGSSNGEIADLSQKNAVFKEDRVIISNAPVTDGEPRVDEDKGMQVSMPSQNVDSERSDSPSSSTSSLSASSGDKNNGELVINGDLKENGEANIKCIENPCASEVKTEYDVEGPFFGHINGHPLEEPVIIYQFELAQYLCGRLIGRNGHFVNQIKEKSNASVVVNRHPLSPHYKICSIEGTRSEIRRALRLIRSRFPVYEFPEVTLQQINVISPLLQACQVTVPQSCQLHLPEGVSCDVILSNVVNAGHIFVRQPTHPTYPSLSRLDQFMNATYSVETPPVLSPNPGDICAVNMCSGWYRAMVVNVWDDIDVEVKFVDYGGYARAPISSLRQIRYDFMTLPFQATECYLANVKPADENQGWSKEANVVFHDLAQGQMLQAKIVAYADDGIPLIHLHKIQGASSIFINQELVNRGLAQWVEHQMWE